MAAYPTYEEIWQLFSHLGKGEVDTFFSRVRPDVDWTIMGTSPMSRRYSSSKEFREATLSVLKPIMKPPGLLMHIVNVIGGGDSEWATAEMKADCECVNGQEIIFTSFYILT